MKRLVIICLSVILVTPVLVLAGLKSEIRSQQRKAELAVADTVRNINSLEARDTLDEGAVKTAAVAPAKVEIFGTNPLRFRVEAHTPWPDWMIYEYDSRTPAGMWFVNGATGKFLLFCKLSENLTR